MESIKEMIDVNTIVGEPVETEDRTVIIPVTKVICGFAAGGGEYPTINIFKDKNSSKEDNILPFGGGSGAGVSVQPVGFLVVGNGEVRLLPIDGDTSLDRVIDLAPKILSYLHDTWSKKNKKDEEVNFEFLE